MPHEPMFPGVPVRRPKARSPRLGLWSWGVGVGNVSRGNTFVAVNLSKVQCNPGSITFEEDGDGRAQE
jgi:hypothetical protein